MLKKITLLLFVGLTIFSNAQKTKKEVCGSLEYIQPPSDPALKNAKTYFIAPNVSYYQGFQASEIKGYFNLQGFSQIHVKENADFVVEVTVYPLTFDSPKSKTNTSKSTKDGVTTTKYSYSYSGNYHYKFTLNAYSKDGISFYRDEYAGSSSLSASGYKSASAAREKYYSNKANASRTFVNSGVKNLSNRMANIFCYLNKKQQVKMMMIKPKKYDYDNFNTAVENLKKAITMQAMNKTVTNESLVLIQEAIGFWQADLKESDPETKKARVNKHVTAAAYFNIGIAYFVMEDYENAAINLEKAQEFEKSVIGYHDYWIKTAKDMQLRAANK